MRIVSHLRKKSDLEEDGVKIVNMYAELSEKKKKLDEEIERLKEAIVRIARKEGVAVLFGSNAKASVRSKEWIKFPGKQEKEREELESTVKEMGKWEEVSTLT